MSSRKKHTQDKSVTNKYLVKLQDIYCYFSMHNHYILDYFQINSVRYIEWLKILYLKAIEYEGNKIQHSQFQWSHLHIRY